MGARPCLKIGGVDYISYVLMNGIEWECNDLDAPESGRTLDAVMHRSRVAQKRKLGISLKPMKTEAFAIMSAAVSTETVTVTFLDPKEGAQVSKVFYGSRIASATMYDDGTDCWWENGKFNLIEI
jgi:hypothetical protein